MPVWDLNDPPFDLHFKAGTFSRGRNGASECQNDGVQIENMSGFVRSSFALSGFSLSEFALSGLRRLTSTGVHVPNFYEFWNLKIQIRTVLLCAVQIFITFLRVFLRRPVSELPKIVLRFFLYIFFMIFRSFIRIISVCSVLACRAIFNRWLNKILVRYRVHSFDFYLLPVKNEKDLLRAARRSRQSSVFVEAVDLRFFFFFFSIQNRSHLSRWFFRVSHSVPREAAVSRTPQ